MSLKHEFPLNIKLSPKDKNLINWIESFHDKSWEVKKVLHIPVGILYLQIYISGGYEQRDRESDKVWCYSPELNRWHKKKSMWESMWFTQLDNCGQFVFVCIVHCLFFWGGVGGWGVYLGEGGCVSCKW